MKRYLVLLLLLHSMVGWAQNGSVLSQRKIADSTANFTGVLGGGVNFGTGVAAIGDLNGNGITELVVGAYDVGGKGAVYTIFMNASGAVDSFKTITENVGGFTGTLGSGNRFGYSVALIGDLDLDGIPDVVASSELDDDGGSDRGAVWILYLKADGTVKSHAKISSTTQGSLLATPAYGIGDLDRFGSEVAGIGDLDGDGIPDIAATAIFDDDGGSNRGAVWVIFLNRNGSIKGFQKISDTQGGFTGTLNNGSFWGSGIASIGDLDSDGVQDFIIGQELENAGGTYKGAAWVLFMNTNGTVKSYRELRNGLTGTGLPTIGDNSMFGSACGALGDIDGDGIPDVAVGANGSDSWRGGVYILMLNVNGTVKAYQKINYNTGGLTGPLDMNDLFGSSITSLGDINGDGKTDIAVGSAFDDDGGSDKGAVYILTLQGVPTSCVNAAFSTANSTICQGDTLLFSNTSAGIGNVTYVWKVNNVVVGTTSNLQYAFNTPGTYTVRLVATNDAPSCVDSMEVTVTVKSTSLHSYQFSLCEGQSRFLAGGWRSTAGTYRDTLVNSVGCDSIVEVVVDVRPASSFAIFILDTTSICQGQSFMGQTQTGLFGDTFFVANVCNLQLHDLRVLPNSTSSTSQTICQGDSVLLGNAWRFTAGTYKDTLVSANNCDSIVTVSLTVLPNRSSSRNVNICQGQSYFVGGANQTTAGIYWDTLVAVNGCDSVVTTNLVVNPNASNAITQTICFGDSYVGYTASGVYNDTFPSSNGCDSVRVLTLTVLPQNVVTITQGICQGQNFEGYTATGIYRDTLQGTNSCDSIRILDLTVGNLIQTNIAQTVCFGDSYLGYSATGTYSDTFATSGCDSVRVLNLTVRPQNTSTITQSICQGQTFEGYTATGIYRDTLVGSNSCDSIRVLDLTVTNVILTSESQTICFGDSYQGYTINGVYSDTTVSSGGCDSIHTLTLTVRAANAIAHSQTICYGDSYEGQTTSGVYVDTLTDANGCDSIHTLTLTVETLPLATIAADNNVLSVADTFASYQWYLDGSLLTGEEADTLAATANGNYTVVVSNAAGCMDTSSAFNITGIGVGEVGMNWTFQLYPNPTTGALYLGVEGANEASYMLYNSLGQLLYNGHVQPSTIHSLNLALFGDGVYYLKLQVAGEVITRKVILAK